VIHARWPRIGEQVSMTPEGQQRWQTTVVQDRRGDLLAVATPAPYVGKDDVRPGQRWIVRYVDAMGEYRFTAVVRAVEQRPVALTWLELADEIEAVQRREHVRFEVRLPARIWVDEDEGEGRAGTGRGQPGSGGGDTGGADSSGLPAATVDISGGGARLRVAKQLPPARFYKVSIQLPDGPVVSRARVIRSCEQRLPDGRTAHHYALAFENLRMADQDRIVRFIFAEQRKLRRRGLS